MIERPRVLVIDDDPDYSALICTLLDELGYTVQSVSELDQCYAATQKFQPSVILLDMYLGPMTGLDLLPALRSQLPDAGILMMSGTRKPDAVFQSLYEGAVDFLEKPLLGPEVDLRIRALLKRHKSRDEMRQASSALEKEKRTLLKYFSGEVAQQILRGEANNTSNGQTSDSTVMFVSLKKTDRIMKQMSPVDFAGFLNQILVDVMDLISSNSGQVNKIQGAGLLATFGIPVPERTNDAKACVGCALRIREHFRLLNESDVFKLGCLEFGIGIASGAIFAGNIGSFRRMEYSLVGDSVNIASRLDNLCGNGRSDILIDRRTKERSGIADATEISERSVRGRKGEVKIYAI